MPQDTPYSSALTSKSATLYTSPSLSSIWSTWTGSLRAEQSNGSMDEDDGACVGAADRTNTTRS